MTDEKVKQKVKHARIGTWSYYNGRFYNMKTIVMMMKNNTDWKFIVSRADK
jgi:hypothetical protein